MTGPTILVTGAAGLLGGEICGRLVDRGFAPIGLINRNPDIRRNDESLVTSIPTIKGDITQPRFGLSDNAWTDLASRIDGVVHCAAVTDFTAAEALHRAVNIDGTRHVLDLAKAADAKLVHISTAYVCGHREGTILESELDQGQSYTNGYEASKSVAEAMVRKSDVRWTIARPSIVLGNREEGRTRSFETIYPILKVFAEGRITTMPAKPSATLDLVPIDHVCDGIMAMVERFDEANGRTFHLVSQSPMPLRAFQDILPKFEGLHCPSFIAPEDFDLESLPPTERRFFMRGAEVYAQYFTRNPYFNNDDFQAFSGFSGPVIDYQWWEKLVDYAIKAGFIKIRAKPRKIAIA